MMFRILILALFCTGCHAARHPMQVSTFEWLPTTNAPTKFPVEVITGEFLDSAGGTIARTPMQAYTANGWGQIGSLDLVGDEKKPLPQSLYIKWLSLTERTAYEGTFDLRPLQLDRYFETGIYNVLEDKHQTYEFIVVGLAPRGAIILWLISPGQNIIVGTFMAEKATSLDTFKLAGRMSLEAYVKMEIDTNLTPDERDLRVPPYEINKWSNEYLLQYNWKPNVIISKPVKNIFTKFFSGEERGWSDTYAIEITGPLRIPKELNVSWESGKRTEISEITPDEEEIFAAFKKLGSSHAALQLQIEINTISFGVRTYLHDGTHMIELKKCRYRRF